MSKILWELLWELFRDISRIAALILMGYWAIFYSFKDPDMKILAMMVFLAYAWGGEARAN